MLEREPRTRQTDVVSPFGEPTAQRLVWAPPPRGPPNPWGLSRLGISIAFPWCWPAFHFLCALVFLVRLTAPQGRVCGFNLSVTSVPFSAEADHAMVQSFTG